MLKVYTLAIFGSRIFPAPLSHSPFPKFYHYPLYIYCSHYIMYTHSYIVMVTYILMVGTNAKRPYIKNENRIN